jgi:hypothetical protein
MASIMPATSTAGDYSMGGDMTSTRHQDQQQQPGPMSIDNTSEDTSNSSMTVIYSFG